MTEAPKKRVVDFTVDDSPDNQKPSTTNLELDFDSLFNARIESIQDSGITKNQVKKAGRRIRKNEGDLKDARSKIQLFRSQHEKPLEHIAHIVTCCSDTNAQVVTRLKRLDTIIDKLTRPSLDGKDQNKTCVTNMNDIGGCRAIFESIECLQLALSKLIEAIEQCSNIKIKDIDDYIANPKGNDCGYRSVHVIFEYTVNDSTLKIETQMRTRAQHLWATTVEIIDLIERTTIKTLSHLPADKKCENQVYWERLLRLMSEVIAGNEGCIDVDAERRNVIRGKLKYLSKKVKANSKLRSFNLVSEQLNSQASTLDKYYIIVIKISDGVIEVLAEHLYSDQREALLIFNNIEQVASSLGDLNALMVATKDISSLNDAYPNYLGDCQAFIEMLELAMK